MRTVFVSGNFNILHPGHLRLLRFARECGDRLVVAVQSDRIAGAAAHVREAVRLEGVQSNNWVDEAFLCDEPITDVIARLKPDIVVKGKEHESHFNAEKAVLDGYGGKLLFSSGESMFSSLDLLQRDFRETDLGALSVPLAYMRRHNVTFDRLAALAQEFTRLKVCVTGDLIIDEYITCDPLGMSQEDPTIVVTPIDSKRFVGGAGIVAAHAAGLGAKVKLLTVAGEDDARRFALDTLTDYGVDAQLLTDATRPTTLKQRYRSKGKTLLRVSHFHQTAIAQELQAALLAQMQKTIKDCDLIVFSDFNYGCLPQKLVGELVTLGVSAKRRMVADSQSSSQVGNIARFKGMDIITPTEREARLSTRNHEDGLVVMAEQLHQESRAKNILLKLGEEGVLVHASQEDGSWLTDQLEALNHSPKDVAGAGDCMLITASMALAAGATIWEAACLGSIAAAIQVGRVGNTPLESGEFARELARMAKASRDSAASARSQSVA